MLRHRLRLRNARDLYLLVGECIAIGSDGIAWRRLLVSKLRQLFRAEMANFCDNQVVGEPYSPQGWIRPISVVDDWQNNESRNQFWQYVRRGRLEDNPLVAVFKPDGGRRVARRCDLLDDDAWYRSSFYRDYCAPLGLDDVITAAISNSSGSVQSMIIQRKRGDEAFSRRDGHFVNALLIELQNRQPHELRPAQESAIMTLPRRMLQVLACLLVGHTVNETAELLGLSVHTVHEHKKRLYKRTGATNRAELADYYRDVAPLLMSMSLDEFPDYQQKLDDATRKPWPAMVCDSNANCRGTSPQS